MALKSASTRILDRLDQAAERIDVVAADDRALRRQCEDELRVAVIDHVVDVEAAAHRPLDPPRVEHHPIQNPIGQEQGADTLESER